MPTGWTRRALLLGSLMGLAMACTAKRNAVPVVEQLEFRPLADGDPYPVELADWVQHNTELTTRVETRTSPSFPPYDDVFIEAPDRSTLQTLVIDPVTAMAKDPVLAAAGYDSVEPPPEPFAGARLIAERVQLTNEPPRWRAHVLRGDEGFVVSGATAGLRASSDEVPNGAVSVYLTEADGERFADLTREYVGRRIAIIVGDEAISVPTVNEEIPGAEIMITPGNDGTSEANSLLARLTSPS